MGRSGRASHSRSQIISRPPSSSIHATCQNGLVADRRRRSSGIVELSDRLDSLFRDVHRRIDERVLPAGELAALRGLAHGAIDRFRRIAKALEAVKRL